MRNRIQFVLGILPLALTSLSCDSVLVGQPSEDPAPPVLVKILVQNNTRSVATDIIDKHPPVACSLTMPCPAANQYQDPTLASGAYMPTCQIPTGATVGTCPDNYSPTVTAPPTSLSTDQGAGTYIRLVFSKLLASTIEDVSFDMAEPADMGDMADLGPSNPFMLHDPTTLQLIGPDGNLVPSAIYWDPSGAPNVSSAPFSDPLGPALVIYPNDPLVPLGRYLIKLNPKNLVDDLGQPCTTDVNGPIRSEYSFAVEGLHAYSNDIGPEGLAPTDVLTFKLDTPIDPATLQVTIVPKGGGAPLLVEAWMDLGSDPTMCAENDTQIDVVPVSAPGVPVNWPVGDFLVGILASASANPLSTFALDGLNTPEAYPPDPQHPERSIEFVVAANTVPTNPLAMNFVLPEMCVVPDGGAPSAADGGVGADLQISPPVDGGNHD